MDDLWSKNRCLAIVYGYIGNRDLKKISQKFLFFIVLGLSVSHPVYAADYQYFLIGEGADNGYINPNWAPQSSLFTIQTIDSDKNKSSDLYVCGVEKNRFHQTKVFDDKPGNRRRIAQRTLYPPAETAMSWFQIGDRLAFLATKSRTANSGAIQADLSIVIVDSDLHLQTWSRGEINDITETLLPMNVPHYQKVFFTSRASNRKNLDLVDLENETFQIAEGITSFDSPIQSISKNQEGRLFIITGEETEYSGWLLDLNNWYQNSQEIPVKNRIPVTTEDFTIYAEGTFCPYNVNWVSLIMSNGKLREEDRAYVGIVDISTGEYVKKFLVFRHKQKSALMRRAAYHQWHPEHEHLFYIKKNSDDQEQLYYYDFETQSEEFSGLQEDNIQSFSISPDGRYLVLLTNEKQRNLKVYRISE